MNLQLNQCPKVENHHVDSFRTDVLEGLKTTPKRLSSKYFYDKTGDRIFQEIMAMPEYYLTQCELDIFKNKTTDLAHLIIPENEPFDLIELGAGDAMKSTFLLKHLVQKGIKFTYMPIDISGNILSILKEKLSRELPDLEILALEGEYFEMLQKTASLSTRKKVILFLGSNIGNMNPEEAENFCQSLNQNLNSGDRVLVGFDLKKNPHTILNAYNDRKGITAAFNLNLLTRINRELDADFDLKQFQHYQTYDPISGSCKSYLVSLQKQTVKIGIDSISFEENELIDMEISQKFSEERIEELRVKSGFKRVGETKDSKKWFVDTVWQVK
ncbi:L-histidine N(alpha)-methyltransferase [Chryseobacterium lathyri]|uniref:Dimethylhistidine N-methyltransferase n=1 Tax=Chryseobacterium lathyri TaxID=395933 RepID=A0ABT9SRM4_9FLAO|nr:L-histidine N(alpha)-methyltransferase [Chryseobacterium lathyri]MDP9962103.1 dimethylhistidine N-methyltransferase [Chryseobacterium lathyri]